MWLWRTNNHVESNKLVNSWNKNRYGWIIKCHICKMYIFHLMRSNSVHNDTAGNVSSGGMRMRAVRSLCTYFQFNISRMPRHVHVWYVQLYVRASIVRWLQCVAASASCWSAMLFFGSRVRKCAAELPCAVSRVHISTASRARCVMSTNMCNMRCCSPRRLQRMGCLFACHMCVCLHIVCTVYVCSRIWRDARHTIYGIMYKLAVLPTTFIPEIEYYAY